MAALMVKAAMVAAAAAAVASQKKFNCNVMFMYAWCEQMANDFLV